MKSRYTYYTPRAQKLPWMTTILLWGALSMLLLNCCYYWQIILSVSQIDRNLLKNYCVHAPKTHAPLFLISCICHCIVSFLLPSSIGLCWIRWVWNWEEHIIITVHVIAQSFGKRSSSCCDATPMYQLWPHLSFVNCGCKLLHYTSQHKIKKHQFERFVCLFDVCSNHSLWVHWWCPKGTLHLKA